MEAVAARRQKPDILSMLKGAQAYAALFAKPGTTSRCLRQCCGGTCAEGAVLLDTLVQQ